MHKRVCGERSNPFTWPRLTEGEIEEMMEVSERSLRINESAPELSWLDRFGIEKGLAKPEGYRRLKLRVRYGGFKLNMT